MLARWRHGTMAVDVTHMARGCLAMVQMAVIMAAQNRDEPYMVILNIVAFYVYPSIIPIGGPLCIVSRRDHDRHDA